MGRQYITRQACGRTHRRHVDCTDSATFPMPEEAAMISKRTTLAVLCAAALVACDAADSVTGPTTEPRLLGGTVPPIEPPPIEKPPIQEFLPGVPVLDPFGEDEAGAVESARGWGRFTVEDGALRTFAFFARTNTDGTTTGSYQVDNQGVSGSREAGRVTCLAVDGDVAWIGGVITHSSLPGREGTPRLFRVVERGHGSPPDQASLLIVTAEANVTCQTRPLLPVQDLDEGKILVRDGGTTLAVLP
jgi:hypothetical protein